MADKKKGGLADALVTAVLEQEGFLEEGATAEVEKEASTRTI